MCVSFARLVHWGEGVAPELLVGCVERHREDALQLVFREARELAGDADGGDGDVARADADDPVDVAHRLDDLPDVQQRLAHPHEHCSDHVWSVDK